MAKTNPVKLSLRKTAEASVAEVIEGKIEALRANIEEMKKDLEEVKHSCPENYENEWGYCWRNDQIIRDSVEIDIWEGLLSDI